MIPLQENSSGSGTISLTSDIYVGQAKADPYVDYMNIKFLGEGTFAQVCKVRNKLTGQIRAMKIIKKSSTCSQADDMEILNIRYSIFDKESGLTCDYEYDAKLEYLQWTAWHETY